MSQQRVLTPRVEGAPPNAASTDERPRGTAPPALGLTLGDLLAIVAISTAVFLFWQGPLWTAPRVASHVARFAVSYLVAVPLTLLALRRRRALDWQRALLAIGAVWGLKLMVTAPLYYLAAHDSGLDLHAAAPSARSAVAGASPPSAGSASAVAELHGVVRAGEVPALAVVVVEDVPAAPHPSPVDVRLVVDDRPSLLLVRTWEQLTARSTDGRLHTVALSTAAGLLSNTPLPAGGLAVPLRTPDAGVYDLGCATHGRVGAMVVVDHDLAARTDDAGRFAISGVPVGRQRLLVVSLHGARTSAEVEVSPGVNASVELTIPGIAGDSTSPGPRKTEDPAR